MGFFDRVFLFVFKVEVDATETQRREGGEREKESTCVSILRVYRQLSAQIQWQQWMQQVQFAFVEWRTPTAAACSR